MSVCETSLGRLGCEVAVVQGDRLEGTDSGRVMVAWGVLDFSEDSVGDQRLRVMGSMVI
jgi:hypothetical protein